MGLVTVVVQAVWRIYDNIFKIQYLQYYPSQIQAQGIDEELDMSTFKICLQFLLISKGRDAVYRGIWLTMTAMTAMTPTQTTIYYIF